MLCPKIDILTPPPVYIYYLDIYGGNHCRGNSDCVLKVMYKAIYKYN